MSDLCGDRNENADLSQLTCNNILLRLRLKKKQQEVNELKVQLENELLENERLKQLALADEESDLENLENGELIDEEGYHVFQALELSIENMHKKISRIRSPSGQLRKVFDQKILAQVLICFLLGCITSIFFAPQASKKY